MAAAARVHRRDQLDARREGDVGIGARHRDLARLDRLAQRIEHRAAEFGELVEEQHAEMGEAHLARPHAQAAAGQRRHRGRMMRAAERARADQPATWQFPRDARHHRDLERLGRRQIGQDAGQAGGEQRFARARRPDHQQVVAAGRRDLERALGDLLPLDLPEIGAGARADRPGPRAAAEVACCLSDGRSARADRAPRSPRRAPPTPPPAPAPPGRSARDRSPRRAAPRAARRARAGSARRARARRPRHSRPASRHRRRPSRRAAPARSAGRNASPPWADRRARD